MPPMTVKHIKSYTNAVLAEIYTRGIPLSRDLDNVPLYIREYVAYKLQSQYKIMGLCDATWKYEVYMAYYYPIWLAEKLPSLQQEAQALAATRSTSLLSAPSSVSLASPARSNDDRSIKSGGSSNSRGRERPSDGTEPTKPKRQKTSRTTDGSESTEKSEKLVKVKQPSGFVSVDHFR